MFVSNPVCDEVTCDSFSISLTSSLVGVLLSSGSGICESDGWGELSVCVTRSASDYYVLFFNLKVLIKE